MYILLYRAPAAASSGRVQKCPAAKDHRAFLELVMWLEHTTCWLRISCSTDWATLAHFLQLAHSITCLSGCQQKSSTITICFHAWKNVAFLHKLSIFFASCQLCRICTVTPPEKHALFQAFPPAEKIKVLTFPWQYVYITFCRLPVCCELSTFSTDFSTPDFLFYFKCLLRFCINKETVETDFVDFAKTDFVTITQISRSRERFEKKLDRQNAGFVPLVMIQSRPLSANDT